MPNRNILQTNIKSMKKLVNDFDNGDKSRDDLLKSYNRAIKQIPDHYNKEFDNKRVLPTTIISRSRWLKNKVKHQDPDLLGIEPKEYMNKLHKSRKDGLWTLYDYKNNEVMDSSPEKCRKIIVTYQNGMQKELTLIQEQEDELDL